MDSFLLQNSIIRYSDVKSHFTSDVDLQNVIKRLVDKGQLKKIKNGLYAVINPITSDIFANRFEIATSLYDDCCVSYHSALEFYGLSNQMYSEVYVTAPRRYNKFEFEGLNYSFFEMKRKAGIVEKEHNSLIRVTDLERTVIDCIDRIDLAGGIDELIMALNMVTYLDEAKLLAYLEELGKKFLYKKTGFFLQSLDSQHFSDKFFKTCKENMSNRADSIVENNWVPKRFNTGWKLIVPQTLINTEH
ncbi:MAG: type IV toxin-antitoxin system AbiEi family antitoxin domain-containing protein [Christensenellales bacterium]|jgi:predicted transcriptional regulator of viral defense system